MNNLPDMDAASADELGEEEFAAEDAFDSADLDEE